MPTGLPEGTLVLRLYVGGRAPNSARAISALRTILQMHVADRYRLEIVDVLDEPLRALQDGILITPTLVKLEPKPLVQIAGNLSETDRVVLALGLEGYRP